jgi:hypothetical protein
MPKGIAALILASKKPKVSEPEAEPDDSHEALVAAVKAFRAAKTDEEAAEALKAAVSMCNGMHESDED